MNNSAIIKDLVKYFKMPALMFAIGFVLQSFFKFSIYIDKHIAMGLGFMTVMVMGTALVMLIYMTVIIFSDTAKRDQT